MLDVAQGKTGPNLLVTVLDWGMGHATRTLPIIRCALRHEWHVHVASRGTALSWLESHLGDEPSVSFHTKPGLDIRYAKRGNFFKIASQIPAFVAHVDKERRWTADFVKDHGVDAIFSDNCYGCAINNVPSILMSHQLQLPVPSMLEGAARAVVARWAQSFDALWVPDTPPGPSSLSGPLAAAHVHPRTAYVGVLSRLAPYRLEHPTPRWHKVGMVSGVEPHRSMMEAALRSWMATDDAPSLIIAGRPGGGTHTEGHITTWHDPSDEALAHALQEAGTVVCRSGYSSQLDLAALGVRAILVPTPGQPEQALLGRLWAERFGFACISQTQLEAGRIPAHPTGELPTVEANLLAEKQLHTWLLASNPQTV